MACTSGLRKLSKLQSQQGMTLVEVLVAGAIMIAIMMALIELVEASYKSQKYASQKYEIQDLGNAIRLNLSQPNFCSCNFPNALDLSGSATIPVTNLNVVPFGACAPVGTFVASSAAPGNLVPGTTSGLRIQQMQIQNFHLINKLSSTSNLYSFDLSITFDPTTTLFAMRPLVLTGLPMTTSVVAAPMEQVTSCLNPFDTTVQNPTQICNSMGGVFLPSGVCTFPPQPASTASGGSGLPSGTIVGGCDFSINNSSRTGSCRGGGALPSTCPAGTNVTNYEVTGTATVGTVDFQCIVP